MLAEEFALEQTEFEEMEHDMELILRLQNSMERAKKQRSRCPSSPSPVNVAMKQERRVGHVSKTGTSRSKPDVSRYRLLKQPGR